ncbi:MAG: hypothetical protein JNK47_12910 [Mesorhizobium sp.]|nr:hypothetical protein [Mesorhizobium sp.]MBL8578120.1 hypothetical protein [Mesorhizobium sp.]
MKTAPTAKEYADAFFGLENQIDRLFRLSELAGYLASIHQEDMEKYPKSNFGVQARMVGIAAREVENAAKELDASWLAIHNDLVDRERL